MVRKTNNSMAVAFDAPTFIAPEQRGDDLVDPIFSAKATMSKGPVKTTPPKTLSGNKASGSNVFANKTPIDERPVSKKPISKTSISKTPAKVTQAKQNVVNKKASDSAPVKTPNTKNLTQQNAAKSPAPTTPKKVSKATGREMKPWSAQKIRKKPTKADDNDNDSEQQKKAFDLWLKQNQQYDSDDDEKPLALVRKAPAISGKTPSSSPSTPKAMVSTPARQVSTGLATPPATQKTIPAKQAQVKKTPVGKTVVDKTRVNETSLPTTPAKKTQAQQTSASKAHDRKTQSSKAPVTRTHTSEVPANTPPVSKTELSKSPSPKAPGSKTLLPKTSKTTGRQPEAWTATKIRKRPAESDVDNFNLWLSQQDSDDEDSASKPKTHLEQDDVSASHPRTSASTPKTTAAEPKQTVSSKNPNTQQDGPANTLLTPSTTPDGSPTKPVTATVKKTQGRKASEKKPPVVKDAYRVMRPKDAKKTTASFSSKARVKPENKKPTKSAAVIKDAQFEQVAASQTGLVVSNLSTALHSGNNGDIAMPDADSLLPSIEEDTAIVPTAKTIQPLKKENSVEDEADNVLPSVEQYVALPDLNTTGPAIEKKNVTAVTPHNNARADKSTATTDQTSSTTEQQQPIASTEADADQPLYVSEWAYELHYGSPSPDGGDPGTPYLVESASPLEPDEFYAYMTIAPTPHLHLEIDCRPATEEDIPFTVADEAVLADLAEVGGKPLFTLGVEEEEGGRVVDLVLEVDEDVRQKMAERGRKRKADEVERGERRVKGEDVRRRLKRARLMAAKPSVRSDVAVVPVKKVRRSWDEKWCFPDSDEEDDDSEEDGDEAIVKSAAAVGIAGAHEKGEIGDRETNEEEEVDDNEVIVVRAKGKKSELEKMFFPDSDSEPDVSDEEDMSEEE